MNFQAGTKHSCSMLRREKLNRKLWSIHQWCSVKKVIFKIFENFRRKNLCWSLFLKKLQDWSTVTLLKKTPTQFFSFENCEVDINIIWGHNTFARVLIEFRFFMRPDSDSNFYSSLIRFLWTKFLTWLLY